ncbi:DUF4352 domain-containing protein [Georgenia sp. TF02-10]|uniref:DUF4352 domain-containing protein n=1 Tax=Georgenia sp. TF02-10 TaxID=2917725 RepID=UPI001FA7AA1F|nr:DUF4352 domain-containing protein [Georgenia sp. TF02-10]UNX53887.1 DUF4352 domain-containing protein [Georgenia sp. TF02-10]
MSTTPPQGPRSDGAAHQAMPGQTFNPQGPDAYATGQYAPTGQYSQPTGPGPRPERRRSWFARHKILTGLLAIIVLVILVNALGGGGDDDNPTAGTTAPGQEAPADEAAPEAPAEEQDAAEADAAAPESAAPEAPGLATPVRDGKFEFTVTAVQPGVGQIGDEMLGEQAQGQFVLVDLTVTNIGEEPQTFFADNQTLVDEQGREHAADSMASIYLEGDDTFVNEINPGNTVTGTIVFDIPVDAVPTSLELHDSAFSGGVTVSLAE